MTHVNDLDFLGDRWAAALAWLSPRTIRLGGRAIGRNLHAEPSLLPDLFGISRPRMHLIALALAHLDRPVPSGVGSPARPQPGKASSWSGVGRLSGRHQASLGPSAGGGAATAELPAPRPSSCRPRRGSGPPPCGHDQRPGDRGSWRPAAAIAPTVRICLGGLAREIERPYRRSAISRLPRRRRQCR